MSIKNASLKTLYMIIFLLAASLSLQACSSEPQEIAAGVKAPDFSLPASSGGEVSLSDYKGEKPALLFFHMAVG